MRNFRDQYEAVKFLSYIARKFGSEVEDKIVEVFGVDCANLNFWIDHCKKLTPEVLEERVKNSYCMVHSLDIDSVIDSALHDYNIAIKLFPNCSEFYAGRGRIYRYMGKEKKAQRDSNQQPRPEGRGMLVPRGMDFMRV